MGEGQSEIRRAQRTRDDTGRAHCRVNGEKRGSGNFAAVQREDRGRAAFTEALAVLGSLPGGIRGVGCRINRRVVGVLVLVCLVVRGRHLDVRPVPRCVHRAGVQGGRLCHEQGEPGGQQERGEAAHRGH